MKRQIQQALSLLSGLVREFRLVAASKRVRGEAAWVALSKVVWFLMTFVGLKAFTNIMSQEAFGEWRLVMTWQDLVGTVLIMPMLHSHLRVFRQAEEEGFARSELRFTFGWYGVSTLGVLVVAGAAALVGGRLGMGRWALLAGGLFYAADQWRFLAVRTLGITRKRRETAMHASLSVVLQVLLGVALVRSVSATAGAALFGYAIAAIACGAIIVPPLIRQMRSSPGDKPSQMMRLVLTYGLPYGALLLCQWVQNFADRYIVDAQMNLKAAAVYVAAFQVSGVPYLLMNEVIQALILPIVYERAKAADDPRQLWAADRVLLCSLALYVVLGAACLLAFLLFGSGLMRLLTSADYVVPSGLMAVLAASRFLQNLLMLLRMVFAIHQKMGAALAYGAVMAAITVPVCWYMVAWYGLWGAAMGSGIVALAATLIMCFGPTGCVQLIRQARRGAA